MPTGWPSTCARSVVLDVARRQPEAARRPAGRSPTCRYCTPAFCAVKTSSRAGNLADAALTISLGQCVQRGEIGAEDLDRHVAAHAGQHFRDAHLDRLGEAVGDAGELVDHLRISSISHSLSGLRHSPCGLQHQEGIGLVEAHRVEPELVGADARDDAATSGTRLQQRLLDRQVDARPTASRLIDGSFSSCTMTSPSSMRRHEGLADQRYRRRRAPAAARRRRPAPALRVRQRAVEQRRVEPPPACAPARARRARRCLQQQRGEHRDHGQRQQQRRRQREHDGQRHRREQLALQPLQRQQRQEHDDDDERCPRSPARRPPAPRDSITCSGGIAGGFPVVRQMRDDVLDHHHRGVDQHADRDRQPAEAHQIGRQAELAHQHERGQRRQRQATSSTNDEEQGKPSFSSILKRLCPTNLV